MWPFNRWSCRIPRAWLSSRTTLRSSRLAPTSGNRDMDTSVTTRAWRKRRLAGPEVPCRPPCLSAAIRSAWVLVSAGARLKSTLVTTDTARVNASTRPSMPSESSCVVGDHLLEAVAALREVPHVGGRRPDELAGPTGRALPSRRVGAHQPVRSRERQGPQRQGLDDAEDQRVGADAQGQREHGDKGEARALAQQAGGVPDVPGEAVQPGPGPDGAQLLLDQRHVAESAARRMAGLLRGQASRTQFLRLELEMRRQLALQLLQPLPAPREPRQPRAQPVPAAHEPPSRRRLTSAMTVDILPPRR